MPGGYSGGFRRNLEVVLSNQDASQVPIGPTVDMARAWPDPFFLQASLFSDVPGKIAEGIGAVGRAIGNFGNFVGEKTEIDEVIMNIVNELYLTWSGPEQIRQGRPGAVAEAISAVTPISPAQPGDISFSRVLGTAGATLGQTFGGGEVSDLGETWQRAKGLSAGQTIVEEQGDYHLMSPEERAVRRAGMGYNLTSGTMDAVLGWFVAPDVLAGKGLKWARQTYVAPFSAAEIEKSVRMSSHNTGYELEHTAGDISGAYNMQVKNANGRRALTVIRQSQYKSFREHGLLSNAPGADKVAEADAGLREIRETLVTQGFDPTTLDQSIIDLEGRLSSVGSDIQRFTQQMRINLLDKLELENLRESELWNVVLGTAPPNKSTINRLLGMVDADEQAAL